VSKDKKPNIFDMPAPMYLRDLAERLMRVPTMYDVDQGDVDRLGELAKWAERKAKTVRER
jgi:hypothetical protein